MENCPLLGDSVHIVLCIAYHISLNAKSEALKNLSLQLRSGQAPLTLRLIQDGIFRTPRLRRDKLAPAEAWGRVFLGMAEAGKSHPCKATPKQSLSVPPIKNVVFTYKDDMHNGVKTTPIRLIHRELR